jgi:hypothetical protein
VISDWIFQDILCQWGALVKIVSANGKPFVTALRDLAKKYHIKHIWISGYNLCANGIIKWSHFDIWQALYKAADGKQNHWAQIVHSVFWFKQVTPRKHMGCSLYYAVTRTHPLLPFNIIETNYLLPSPESLLSSTDLIACCAVALQKCKEDLAALCNHIHATHNWAAVQFERDHESMIHDFNFKPGHLVVIWNTAVEKLLNCKMCPHYMGPLMVVSRNCGSTYILCKLDGMLAQMLSHLPWWVLRGRGLAYVIRIGLSHRCVMELVSHVWCCHIYCRQPPLVRIQCPWFGVVLVCCYLAYHWSEPMEAPHDLCHLHPLTWYSVSHDGLSWYELLCCTYRPCLLMLHGIPYDSITSSHDTWFAVL